MEIFLTTWESLRKFLSDIFFENYRDFNYYIVVELKISNIKTISV